MLLADAFPIFRDKNPAFNMSVIPPKNITTGNKMKPKFTKNSGILENVSVPDNKGGLNFETGYENENGDNITVIIIIIKFNFRQGAKSTMSRTIAKPESRGIVEKVVEGMSTRINLVGWMRK